MFEEEKPFLMKLPSEPHELSQWKVATVAPNYHIAVDKMNYSVPYEYIRQKVDIRVTRNMVEVFFGGNRICSHMRLHGRPNQYSTNEDHMPSDHKQYVAWNGMRFILSRSPQIIQRSTGLPVAQNTMGGKTNVEYGYNLPASRYEAQRYGGRFSKTADGCSLPGNEL